MINYIYSAYKKLEPLEFRCYSIYCKKEEKKEKKEKKRRNKLNERIEIEFAYDHFE